MPARGPVIRALGSSRKRSSHRLGELGDHLARAVFRGNQLVAVLTNWQQPHRQIGDAGVGEALEPREDRLLVTGRGQIADIAGVAAIQQLLIVGRRLRLGQNPVRAFFGGVDLGVRAQADGAVSLRTGLER